ncbi:MAG: FHA domain-containing protein [Chthoniobacterales bacterium]
MPQIRVYLSEDNQAVHELTDETITVGRLPDNTIQIEDGSVSSHHAELVLEGGEYHLHDKGSTNGTFVNGEQTTSAILKDGDQVRFGSIESIFAADVKSTSSSAPLPQSEKATASLGSDSARPTNFVNASPFPKPKEKTDPLSLAAMIIGALGAVGFLAAVVMTLMLQAPA